MIVETARDEFTLANDLMDECKKFLRVFHCDDDGQINLMLGAAIEQFERTNGVTVFPTDYEWTVEGITNGSVAITPEQRITPCDVWSAWAPDENGDPQEVTADYSVRRQGLHGPVFYSLVGAAQTGLVLRISSGYVAAPLTPPDRRALPFGIRSTVFQLTSKFYEYRDIVTPGNLETLPVWFNHEISGFWVPVV